MWMSIFFLLLLVSIQNLHGLICYSNSSFNYSRNEFNWNNFSNLNHQTISNTSSCHVRLIIDYNKNNVIIKFHPIINSSNTNIKFSSTISFLQNEISSIINSLDYSCSSENLCDKIFFQKWSKQLFDINTNSLYNHLISSWNNSQICQRKFKTNYCESYLCFTIYNELKHLSYGKYQCEDKFSTNPINIHIKTTIGNIHNEYQCIKNHCTGEILYKKPNSTEKLIDQNQINRFIFKQTMIIVGILLIIGSIAYYIQHRKFKQGYKLTINP